ncbi:universal stress protein [Halomonas saccharevitans]|uniref:Universal stress protein family protein n=1 Tax=Halomonas saccharevitans TaxID=416872 RepID=A0A1I7BQ76_9GAMM|nr:universal stress protein [Halomonas saccharevitans]SFT89314.1 Universal stress protein family protein [Halomonas saccharevitans]
MPPDEARPPLGDDPSPSSAGQAVRVVRVLTLLDASRHSLAALAAAVDLAVAPHAELVALFVEDQELVSSAGFPFAREIGAVSGRARRRSRDDLVVGQARQARRVAEALEAAVSGRELRHELRISRGAIVSEAQALAGPGDVLMLGKAGFSSHWGVRLGSTSRALMLEAPCTVIIWDERLPLAHGPLRTLAEAEAQAPYRMEVPEVLARLFEGEEVLEASNARELEHRLRRATSGALLLHRPRLARLAEQDPDLLARLPIPLIVVP